MLNFQRSSNTLIIIDAKHHIRTIRWCSKEISSALDACCCMRFQRTIEKHRDNRVVYAYWACRMHFLRFVSVCMWTGNRDARKFIFVRKHPFATLSYFCFGSYWTEDIRRDNEVENGVHHVVNDIAHTHITNTYCIIVYKIFTSKGKKRAATMTIRIHVVAQDTSDYSPIFHYNNARLIKTYTIHWLVHLYSTCTCTHIVAHIRTHNIHSYAVRRLSETKKRKCKTHIYTHISRAHSTPNNRVLCVTFGPCRCLRGCVCVCLARYTVCTRASCKYVYTTHLIVYVWFATDLTDGPQCLCEMSKMESARGISAILNLKFISFMFQFDVQYNRMDDNGG